MLSYLIIQNDNPPRGNILVEETYGLSTVNILQLYYKLLCVFCLNFDLNSILCPFG